MWLLVESANIIIHQMFVTIYPWYRHVLLVRQTCTCCNSSRSCGDMVDVAWWWLFPTHHFPSCIPHGPPLSLSSYPWLYTAICLRHFQESKSGTPPHQKQPGGLFHLHCGSDEEAKSYHRHSCNLYSYEGLR